MSGNNKDFDFLSFFAGTQNDVFPNPFAPVKNPPVPTSHPAPAFPALMRALTQAQKPKPPALSVQHMAQILEESLGKKLDVNPGRQLPTIFDLAIGEGRKLNAAFVYTDLTGYSKLISAQGTGVGFKLVQGFVTLVEKITGHFGGAVVDCAGDRTLSVFYRPNTDNSVGPIREAITAALWIQTAMFKVVGPRFAAFQVNGVQASIGIDYGSVIAGCVGVRGNKRLVFFGDAPNLAAKLQDEGTGGETVISPFAFQYRPSYLNNGTWRFEPQFDVRGSLRCYKTNYCFIEEVPVHSELYFK